MSCIVKRCEKILIEFLKSNYDRKYFLKKVDRRSHSNEQENQRMKPPIRPTIADMLTLKEKRPLSMLRVERLDEAQAAQPAWALCADCAMRASQSVAAAG
jgi:hypothetical protein